MSIRKTCALRWFQSICLTVSISAVVYPFRSLLAKSVSRPDILFSVDALSIEQSGISKWIEEKYPFLSEWADGLGEDFQFPSDVYEAMGLDEKDFSHFSLRLDGLDSSVQGNVSAPLSLSQFFLEMNIWAEKPMYLSGFMKWLEDELASEFGSKNSVNNLLVDKWMNDTELRFTLDLQEFSSIFGAISQDSASIDNNFSVHINLEDNRTKIRGFLTSPIDRQLIKIENFEQVSLLSQLDPERQVTFYLKIPEIITSNYFPDAKAGDPFAAVIDGVEKIAWGTSFRDHSVFFQFVIGCKENSVASALVSLLQGSLGMAQLGLMDDANAQTLLSLLSNVKFEPNGKLVEISLEVTSAELGQVISGQLSSLAPKPPLQLHTSGPKSLIGKEAPAVILPTISDVNFSLVSKKGKVVVLDFWASWSRSCHLALPILMDVSSRYPASEFFLMTINQKETKKEISDFLNHYNLDSLPVAMDLEGEISKVYQVQGIPQTIIINQEGKVEKVWVGFSPFLEKDLVAEINELLAR